MKTGRSSAALPTLTAFGIVAACFPGWRPLLDSRFFQSHDGFEHAYRVLAIATALQHGIVLPRWVPELALGFGYPLFAVYSPLAYYPPALMSLAGMSVLTALKVDLALLCVACAACAYYAARAIGGRWASLVAATCYACAPYTLANAYVRLDLAELSAFPLTALAVGGLLRLDIGARQHRTALSLSTARSVVLAALPLALLPLAHSLSTLTFLPTLLALSFAILAGSWRSKRTRFAAAVLGATGMFALGLCAWFVLPAVQWQGWLRLADLGSDSHFAPKLLDVPHLFASPNGWTAADWFGGGGRRWFFSIAPGPFGELPAFPSYVSLMAAVASVVVVCATRSACRRVVVALVAAACLSLWFATTWSGGVWQAFPRLTQLQFPWRVVGPVSLDVALLSALFVAALPTKAQPAAAVVLILAMGTPAMLLVAPAYRPIDLSATTWPSQLRRELQGGFGTTGSGLFLPKWVATDIPGDFGRSDWRAASSATSPLEVASVSLGPGTFSVHYISAEPRSVQVGTLYAPPWTMSMDGKVAPSRPAPGTGLLAADLPAGAHTLGFTLGHTSSEAAGAATTLLAAIGAMVLVLRAPDDSNALSEGAAGTSRELGNPGTRPALALHLGPTPLNGGNSARWPRLALCLPLMAIAFAAVDANLVPIGGAAPMAAPAAPSEGSSLAVGGWRLESSAVWGTPPSLDLLLFSRRPISADEDIVVRARGASGGDWVERRQPPRMGTVGTRGWPANLLLEDHALLPGPRDLCPGPYEIQVGFAVHGQHDLESSQDLGVVDVGRGGAVGCAPLETDATTAAAAAVTGFSIDGESGGSVRAPRPGRDSIVVIDLRALGPTEGDDAVTLQLLDNTGRVVAQRDSYANVDSVFTSIWRPEDRASIRFQLPIPTDLPIGVYHIDVGLYSGSRSRFDPLLAPGSASPTAGLVRLATSTVRPPSQPSRETQASFGGLFGLLGVTVNGGRETVPPGTAVPVDLLWQCLAPSHDDYTLFVQVLDAAGRLVAQQDGPPLGGRYPTSAWEPGDVVDERRSVALPAGLAPGEYSVVVGWYAQPSGQRLPTTPERTDRAVPVGTLIIAG